MFSCIFSATYSEIFSLSTWMEFFLNGANDSVNSTKSGNLINHLSIGVCGSILVSYTTVAGWRVPALYFCHLKSSTIAIWPLVDLWGWGATDAWFLFLSFSCSFGKHISNWLAQPSQRLTANLASDNEHLISHLYTSVSCVPFPPPSFLFSTWNIPYPEIGATKTFTGK